MSKFFKALGLFLALIAGYLLIIPSPITPVPLSFPTMELAEGEAMPTIEVLFNRVCEGCEDISLDGRGNLYAGSKDGRLLKFPIDGKADRSTEVVRFKGRPLGLEVLGDSLAWVCVEHEGLARVDLKAKKYDIVVTGFNDTTFQLIDYLDLDTLGRVYFTDASDRYGDDDLQLDVLEGNPNGALYRFDPSTGKTERLLDNLRFANGVAVSPDQSFVLVNETAGFRVSKYWLTGPKAGTSERILEGLPGWPDGISLGSDGLYYLTLISPRTGMHDFILPRPWTRTLVTKLPRALWPAPIRANRILAIDGDGKVVHQWQDDAPLFSSIASLERVGDVLWFGTLTDKGVGRVRLE